jgi:hypothetical protein
MQAFLNTHSSIRKSGESTSDSNGDSGQHQTSSAPRQSAYCALVLVCCCGQDVFHSLRKNNPFIDIRMLVNNLPLTVTYLATGHSV